MKSYEDYVNSSPMRDGEEIRDFLDACESKKERKIVYVLGWQEEIINVYGSKKAMETELQKDAVKVEHDPIYDGYITYDNEGKAHHYWYEEMEVIE